MWVPRLNNGWSSVGYRIKADVALEMNVRKCYILYVSTTRKNYTENTTSNKDQCHVT